MFALAVGLASACSSFTSEPVGADADGGTDSGITVEAGGGDAGGACEDPAKDFGAPVLAPEVDEKGYEESDAIRIGNDVLLTRRGGVTTAIALRAKNANGTFDATQKVGFADNDMLTSTFRPSFDPTGTILYFLSTEAEGTANELRRGTRTSAASYSFKSESLHRPGLDSLFASASSLWTADGKTGISVSAFDDQGRPLAAAKVDGLSGSPDETSPVVTRDELTIYFSSSAPAANRKSGRDIWTAHRATPSAPFTDARVLSALSSDSDDDPSWISADGCELFLTQTKGASSNIYRATR